MNNKICILLVLILISCANIASVFAEVTLPKSDDIPGEIDHEVYERSIPERMKIGDSYTVKIPVKNTGEARSTFRVVLTTTKVRVSGISAEQGYGEYIYPRYGSEVLELDKGESRTVEFILVPIKPVIGQIDVTANVYYVKSREILKSNYILSDTAEKKINLIEPAFKQNEQGIIKMVIIFSLFLIIILIIK